MPQRSNVFQKVVYLVQTHLAGPSEVIESAMLADRSTGTLREVDVVVRGNVSGRTVIISFECRQHLRRQSVGWVEEMYSKHSRLPTNLLVLVSASGFSAEAIRVAHGYGIETVTPGIADENAATTIVGRLNALWYKEISVTPLGAEVIVDRIEAIDGHGTGGAFTGEAVFDESGTEQGSLYALVVRLVQDLDFKRLLRDADGTEDTFEVGFGDIVFDGTGGEAIGPVYVKNESVQPPILRQVRQLRVTGSAKVVVAEVPLTHAEMAGTPYSYGQAAAGERTVLLVVTEADPGSRTITLKLTPEDS